MYNIKWESRNIYATTEGNDDVLKKLTVYLMLCMCLFLPAMTQAEETTVLEENELSRWVDQVLRDTAPLTPVNAPVGEEALTEDGYAFLYDFATLYYNKPELDAQSILNAVVLTDESYAAVRGIRLGSTEEELVSAFGQQNPYLLGDGTFASLYSQDDLARAAYWSWAQMDENAHLTGVQCAMHVQAAEDRYTDAGVMFALENGAVSEIRIYGLHSYITAAEVQANLETVYSVENAIGQWAMAEEEAEGYTAVSSAAAFAENDLAFSGMDFRTLTIDQLNQALGEEARTEQLDTENERMITAEWSGAYLSGPESGKVDVLSVTDSRIAGPRGVRTGETLAEVLSSFASDGEGRVYADQAILYGDGQNAPFGVLETDGGYAAVSYTAQMQREGEWINVTLLMQFADELLEEWMIYTW